MRKTPAAIKKMIVATLDDNKANDIVALDIKKLTDIADYMIICSGNSTTHNKALTEKVVSKLISEGIKTIGVEGHENREWYLVDIGDIIVHIMLPQTREFYSLEKLWEATPSDHKKPATKSQKPQKPRKPRKTSK
jgi:ribosome-associated protein